MFAPLLAVSYTSFSQTISSAICIYQCFNSSYQLFIDSLILDKRHSFVADGLHSLKFQIWCCRIQGKTTSYHADIFVPKVFATRLVARSRSGCFELWNRAVRKVSATNNSNNTSYLKLFITRPFMKFGCRLLQSSALEFRLGKLWNKFLKWQIVIAADSWLIPTTP